MTASRCHRRRARHGAPWASRLGLAWLGLVPFLAFATLFLLIPTAYLVVGSFQDADGGQITLQNYVDLAGGPTIAART